MNNWFGIGNLTADPQVQSDSNGRKYCRFTIAINKKWKDANGELQEKANFINCVAWNQLAENLATYQKKGNKISVMGEIQTGSYETEQGDKKYTFDVIASKIEFLNTKSDGRPAPEYTGDEEVSESTSEEGLNPDEVVLESDDLPF